MPARPRRPQGVKAVVTLNEEFEIFISPEQYAAAGIRHMHLPTIDFLFAPPLPDLHRGADFIAGGLSKVICSPYSRPRSWIRHGAAAVGSGHRIGCCTADAPVNPANC